MASLHYLPPEEQVLECYVPGRYIGFPIEKYFANRFTYLSEAQWSRFILEGLITVNGSCVLPGRVLVEHDYIISRLGFRQEPPANRSLKIMHEDSEIRVFNKAAPIPVHPSGRYHKNSMTEILKERFPDEIPRPVQRLDTGTTGVLVFARTKKSAAFLMDEFYGNQVHKIYLTIVEGIPKAKRFRADRPIGKLNGSLWGTGPGAQFPKPSVTEFEHLSSIGGRSLLRAVPRTGRTNQIRVHLQSAGLPIWNDPVYGRGSKGNPVPLGLHAYRMKFRLFERGLEFTAPLPEYFQPFIENPADI